jgi:hypothetical protein
MGRAGEVTVSPRLTAKRMNRVSPVFYHPFEFKVNP